jgi:hypothetical protein
MPIRPDVRDIQRTIAALDAAHARAIGALDQAVARRTEIVADQDCQVAEAQSEVERAVADMANQISIELTSQLLGLDPAAVRRYSKTHRAAGYEPGREAK